MMMSLIGVLRAWHRLESWCASGALTAIARRRPAQRTAPAPAEAFPAHLSEFVVDEVAAALTLTSRAADTQLSSAWPWIWRSDCPARRMPCTRASSILPRLV